MGFRRAITRSVWYTRSMMLEAPELKESIAYAVHEYANKKREKGVKSISRMNSEKVGLILYLFCLGVSQSQMVKRRRIDHETIKHTLTEYADHLGKWTEFGARISEQLFLNLHSLHWTVVPSALPLLAKGKIFNQKIAAERFFRWGCGDLGWLSLSYFLYSLATSKYEIAEDN